MSLLRFRLKLAIPKIWQASASAAISNACVRFHHPSCLIMRQFYPRCPLRGKPINEQSVMFYKRTRLLLKRSNKRGHARQDAPRHIVGFNEQ